MNMLKITIAYAVILILIGLIGYLGTGMASLTALIPAFFGVAFLTLGVISIFKSMSQKAYYAALVLALLAVIFTIGGVFDIGAMLSGEVIERPGAAVSKAIMAIFSLGYFILSLWLFISTRLLNKDDNQGDKPIEL